MSFFHFRIQTVLLGGLLCLSQLRGGSLWALHPSGEPEPEGYTTVINYEGAFLAAGTDGRIDWISRTGKITKTALNPEEDIRSLLAYDQLIIAAGTNGSILISSLKVPFRKIDSRTDEKINSLAVLKGNFIAAADHGELLIGDQNGVFKNIQLELKGNIVSLSARVSDCYGVTDEGEIIHTTDGINWTIFDFNKEYAGYYPACNFTSVVASDLRIAVAGSYGNGGPALFFSTQGHVWTEGMLNFNDDHGRMSYLTEIPLALFYDQSEDQIIMACSGGNMMVLPSCTHCNKLFILSAEDLLAVSGNENTLIVVGENYSIKTITSKL